jgi:hypothetical protein
VLNEALSNIDAYPIIIQVIKHEVGGACSTYERLEIYTIFRLENL